MDSKSCLALWAIILLGLTSSLSALKVTDKNGNSLVLRVKRQIDSEANTATRLGDLLREARTDDGNVDLNAMLTKSVRDPVPLENFNVSSSGIFTNIFGQFSDLQLHGLKQFTVKRVTMNLSKMNLSAVMSIPLLRIVGDYFLDGTVTFFPLSGEGGFWMNLSSIELRGHSIIHSTSDGRLSMGAIKLDSEVGDIALHFENLMGGGTWGTISNSILNQLSELILGELKHSLLKELSDFLRHQFNDVLFQKLPKGFMDPETTNIVDSVLRQASVYMAESGTEPLALPDYKEVFERQLFFVTTRGELRLFNGTLNGLPTLYRKGDVITVFANNSIIFEAYFGFENLSGGYSWQAHLFGTGPSGVIDLQVKSVEGFVRIKQDLKAGSKLELDALHINDIRHVWFDIQGLGTWDYVIEAAVNLVTNGLKLQLADTIALPVKNSIQKELDSLNISIPS